MKNVYQSHWVFSVYYQFNYISSAKIHIYTGNMTKEHTTFIANLKKLRKERKFSQAQLAEHCEVTTGTIGNIECGLANPSFDLILKMAEVLGTHPSYLFATEDILLKQPEPSRDKLLLAEIYKKLKLFFGEA